MRLRMAFMHTGSPSVTMTSSGPISVMIWLRFSSAKAKSDCCSPIMKTVEVLVTVSHADDVEEWHVVPVGDRGDAEVLVAVSHADDVEEWHAAPVGFVHTYNP